MTGKNGPENFFFENTAAFGDVGNDCGRDVVVVLVGVGAECDLRSALLGIVDEAFHALKMPFVHDAAEICRVAPFDRRLAIETLDRVVYGIDERFFLVFRNQYIIRARYKFAPR
jgi:hypothetical protein